ncbi:MAG: MBL fold metallo-hydrolase [Verrucomicrobiota bacterium]
MAKIQINAYCGGVFQTNGYLVQVDDSAWLFDAPEGVAAWIQSQGITLNGLFLTHQHHDHVIGAGRVKDVFDCPIFAWAAPSEDLTLAHRLEEMMGIPCPLDDYPVDTVLNGENSVEVGTLSFEILHVPGHSPDSICFRLVEQPLLIGGDVLFAGGIGRTDFPHGDHDLLINGIHEKLWPRPVETQVLPGHGPATTIGHEKATNPFL